MGINQKNVIKYMERELFVSYKRENPENEITHFKLKLKIVLWYLNKY